MFSSQLAMKLDLRDRPWIYSCLAAVTVWVATEVVFGNAHLAESLRTVMNFATFFVIVGVGQMFVMSSGVGNVDLSVPGVITLSALVAMSVMKQQPVMIVPGFVCALLVGCCVGVANFILLQLLNIPAIVATLATNFVLQSLVIFVSGTTTLKPPAAFRTFFEWTQLGVPILPVLSLLLTVSVAWTLRRTVFGRSVIAVGQSQSAAWLAGVDPVRIRLLVYVISGVAAALTGVLLAGFSGGTSLDMGNEYQLASIAVVVVGGTSALGGRAFPQGIWGASIFLYALANLLNLIAVNFNFGASGPGIRLILTGLLIVGIVTLSRESD